MLSAKRLAIGVPLLVISAIAGQAIFSSKVTGNMVSAHWGGPNGVVDLIPADTPDGRAYSVYWQGCTLNHDFAHRYCLSAGGLAPKSAIRTRQVDTVGIDLDTSMLSAVFYMSGEDCRTGTCIQLFPPVVALHGAFTIYRGPGSYTEESHGSTRRDDIFAFGGITSSQAFTGTRIRYSANFAGAVGPITVATDSGLYNGLITIMSGQQAYQTVYPPAP